MPSSNIRTDIILPITPFNMNQIVIRQNIYEFRRFRIPTSVKRVWFYLNAPDSRIAFICEIDPPGDIPLPQEGFDYASRVRSVWALHEPLTLQTLKQRFAMKGAPRTLMYVPRSILDAIPVTAQQSIWTLDEPTVVITTAPQKNRSMKRKLTEEEVEPRTIKRRRSFRLARRGSLLKTPSCDAMDVD